MANEGLNLESMVAKDENGTFFVAYSATGPDDDDINTSGLFYFKEETSIVSHYPNIRELRQLSVRGISTRLDGEGLDLVIPKLRKEAKQQGFSLIATKQPNISREVYLRNGFRKVSDKEKQGFVDHMMDTYLTNILYQEGFNPQTKTFDRSLSKDDSRREEISQLSFEERKEAFYLRFPHPKEKSFDEPMGNIYLTQRLYQEGFDPKTQTFDLSLPKDDSRRKGISQLPIKERKKAFFSKYPLSDGESVLGSKRAAYRQDLKNCFIDENFSLD